MGVGKHEFLMTSGDVLFLRPAQDHEMLDCSEDLDLFVLAATPELAARFSTGSLRTTTTTLSLPWDRIRSLQENLAHLHDVESADPHERTVGGLFEWALPKSPRGHVTSRHLLTAIYGPEDHSEGTLARDLGLDAAELSRRFAADLGVKFVEARARMRLIRFIQSVDRGSSLTRAAAEHFGSYAQCHRVFRRYLGCAPREYFAGRRRAVAEATWSDQKPAGSANPTPTMSWESRQSI